MISSFYALNDVFLTLGQPEDEPASRKQLGSEGERRRIGAGLSLMREGLCERKHKSHGATTCHSFFHRATQAVVCGFKDQDQQPGGTVAAATAAGGNWDGGMAAKLNMKK